MSWMAVGKNCGNPGMVASVGSIRFTSVAPKICRNSAKNRIENEKERMGRGNWDGKRQKEREVHGKGDGQNRSAMRILRMVELWVANRQKEDSEIKKTQCNHEDTAKATGCFEPGKTAVFPPKNHGGFRNDKTRADIKNYLYHDNGEWLSLIDQKTIDIRKLSFFNSVIESFHTDSDRSVQKCADR